MSFQDVVIGSGDVRALLGAGLLWSARLGVLLGATWLLAAGLRRAPAAVRHRLWVTAMAAALALPVIRSASPWRWEVAPLAGRSAVARWAAEPPAAAVAGSVGAVPVTVAPGRPAGVDRVPGSLVPAALAIWAGGTAVALAALLLGSLRLAAIGRRGRRPDAPGFGARLERLAAEVGLDGPVPVLESADIALPLTHGVLRPRVLLPAGAAATWSGGRLDAVLLHELAHVRRDDVVAHLLGRVVCAVHWFNPLVWAAAARMARESERACDDLVLRAGTRPSAYAAHLLSFVKAARAPAPAPALSMARRSEIEGRIVALLDPTTLRGPVPRRVGATVLGGVLALGLLISLPGAARGPDPEPVGGSAKGADPAAPALDARIGEKLLELLTDADPSVREAAAQSAGERRFARAVPGLVAALTDPVAAVREEAARALGDIADPAAVDALAELTTRRGERDDVREAAVEALGEIGTADAVARLASTLERTADEGLRHELVEALGDTERPEAVAVLGELIERGDRRLRRRVLDALADIESEAALGVVLEQMESADPSLRRMAAEALGGER